MESDTSAAPPGTTEPSGLALLGLGPLEIRAYQALASVRELRPDELRTLLGQERGAADRTFAALAEKGLLFEARDPHRLVAMPPDVVGEALIQQRMAQLHAARAEFAKLAHEYRSAVDAGETSTLVEVIPQELVPRMTVQLNHQATTDVMWVNAPPYLGTVEAPETHELQRLSQGVRYRCIYARQMLDDPYLLEVVRRDMLAGEQARVVDRVPLKLGIVDRRIALVPLLTGSAASSLLVHRCSLLDALIALFETMWLSALPLDGIVGAACDTDVGGGLASEDSRLLTLLLAGNTDEAVARHLGMSKRTVVRRVRQLMDRAGVTSRMQLGWQASQLGWIDPPAMTANSPRFRSEDQDDTP
ncbi:hypothetical protein [Micromonospora sp. NPDC047074]|uniref:hypothetical protein n=1 Tax=Micromonospora sp. NPDC047074 TaxID=3154339 RepID=UPI0034010206